MNPNEHRGNSFHADHDLQHGSGYAGSSWQSTHHPEHFDPDYEQWRAEHMRALDNDYHHWRQDRYQKFSEDFNKWRSERSSRQGLENGGAPQFGAQDTSDSTRYGNGGNRMCGTTGSQDEQSSTVSVGGAQPAELSGVTPSPTSSVSGLAAPSSSSSSPLGRK